MKLPILIYETSCQKAARRKHAKRALVLLLEAAGRMEKAKLPLVIVTGSIGEAWAVARYAMLPKNNAAAPWDGWLPDNRTVGVECRYAPKGGSGFFLNPRRQSSIDLLLALEITDQMEVDEIYFGSYSNALSLAGSEQPSKAYVPWAALKNLRSISPVD